MAGFRMPTTQQRRLAESQKHLSLWRRHAQSVTAYNLHRFDNLRERDLNVSSRHTLSKGRLYVVLRLVCSDSLLTSITVVKINVDNVQWIEACHEGCVNATGFALNAPGPGRIDPFQVASRCVNPV